MTRFPILRRNDEMDDLSKAQSVIRVYAPLGCAVHCLRKCLIHVRRINQPCVQKDFPVQRLTREVRMLGTDF